MLSTYEGERKQQHQEQTKDELVKIRQRVDLMMEVYDNDQGCKSEVSPIEFFNSLEELQRLFDNQQMKRNYLSKFRVFVVGLQSGFEKKHSLLHSVCESLQQLHHKLTTETVYSHLSETNLSEFSINEALSTLQRSIERLGGIKSTMRNVFEIQTSHLDSSSRETVEDSLNIAEEGMNSISNYLNKMRESVAVSNNKLSYLRVQVEQKDQEIQKLKSLLQPMEVLRSISNEPNEVDPQHTQWNEMNVQQKEDFIRQHNSARKLSPSDHSLNSHRNIHTPNYPPNAKRVSLHKSGDNIDALLVPPTHSPHSVSSRFLNSYIPQSNTGNLIVNNKDMSHSRKESLQSPDISTDGTNPSFKAGFSSNILQQNISKMYDTSTDSVEGNEVAVGWINEQNAGVQSPYDTTQVADLYTENSCDSKDDFPRIIPSLFTCSLGGHDNTSLQQSHKDSNRVFSAPIKLPLILNSQPNTMHNPSSSIHEQNSANLHIQEDSLVSDPMNLALKEQLIALQNMRLQEARDYKRAIYLMQEELERFKQNSQLLIANDDPILLKQTEQEFNLFICNKENESIERNLRLTPDIHQPIGITDILHLIIEIHNVFIDVITQTQDNFSEHSIDSLQSLKFSSLDIGISQVCFNLKKSLACLTGLVDTKKPIDEVRRTLPKIHNRSFLDLFGDYFNDLGFKNIFQSFEELYNLSSNHQFEDRSEISFFTELDYNQNCKILDQCELVGTIGSSHKSYVVSLQYFYIILTMLRWRVFTKFILTYNSLSNASLSEYKNVRRISRKMDSFRNTQACTTRQINMRRYFISKRLTKELIHIEKSTGKYFIKPIYSLPNKLSEELPILEISSLSQKIFTNISPPNLKNHANVPQVPTKLDSAKPKPLRSSDELVMKGSNIPRKNKCTTWVNTIYSND